MREALVKRHNRDEFQLATKMPMRDVKSCEDMGKSISGTVGQLRR